MKLELALLGLPCPQRGSTPTPQATPPSNTCRTCGKPIPDRWVYCNPCLEVRSATTRIDKIRTQRRSIPAKGVRR